jgi:hypothetical protein
VEEQERRGRGDGIAFGLEAGQEGPQDRKEDQEPDDPADRGDERVVTFRGRPLVSGVQILADETNQE